MNNKAVRRIFKKTLGLNGAEEFVDQLKYFESHLPTEEIKAKYAEFSLSMLEVAQQLDAAFSDQEKVIEIRDRSLSISSKEMTLLNEEIMAAGEKQKSVIERLTEMLDLLTDHQVQSNPQAQDLEKIIDSVEKLIASQVRSAKSLKILFEEGRKISASLKFSALQGQIQDSMEQLGAREPMVVLGLAAGFLEMASEDYFLTDDLGKIVDRVNPESYSSLAFTGVIHSVKNEDPIALLIFECKNEVSETKELQAQLQALIPNIAATLENINLMKQEKLKDHLANELKTARFVQKALLPAEDLQSPKGIDIHGTYESASECGGDWWSHGPLIDGRHLIMVGDVTGHGTASAMISAVVKGYCDSLVLRHDLKPSQILRELNVVVFNMAQESRRAMTMAVLIFDPKKNEIIYANAGHPHPIILSGLESATAKYLMGSGNILGISLDSEYQDKVSNYQLGERFVLYSDGLTESLNDRSEMYGDRRLLRLLKSLDKNLSAEATNEAILNDRFQFSNGQSLNDDVTTVVVRLAL
jgi:sigma-B regulation protein RsbU (phosphoserine phosphatase)